MAKILSIISILLILLYRKLTTKSLLTPSGTLAATWLVFLLFQTILAPRINYSLKTHISIITFILSFTIGEHYHFLLFWKRKAIAVDNRETIINNHNEKKYEFWLRIFVIGIGLFSLLGSILYAKIISDYFGSIKAMLNAGWAVRGAIAEGKIYIPRIIRGISVLGYSGIVLSIIYWIKYKFRYFISFSFISLIIFSIAQNGRAGVILIVIQIFIGSYWKDIVNNMKRSDLRLIKRVSVPFVIILVIFVGGNMYREQKFFFDNNNLKSSLNTFIIYAFGAIGSLTTYLNNPAPKILGYGRFSFASLFDLLGIHKNVMGVYTDYLSISNIPGEVSNIYTVIRPALDDFGIIGSILYFFIVGYICSYGYKKAINGNLKAISFSIVSYSYIIHTPLLPMTVHNSYIVSMILPILIIYFVELVSIEKSSSKSDVLKCGR